MANTYIESNFESVECPICNKDMELVICGVQGLWVCFLCKELERKFNWLGRIISKSNL